MVNNIAVSGSDVYLVGFTGTFLNPVATYCKNGIAVLLGDGVPTNIILSGNDIYVGGNANGHRSILEEWRFNGSRKRFFKCDCIGEIRLMESNKFSSLVHEKKMLGTPSQTGNSSDIYATYPKLATCKCRNAEGSCFGTRVSKSTEIYVNDFKKKLWVVKCKNLMNKHKAIATRETIGDVEIIEDPPNKLG